VRPRIGVYVCHCGTNIASTVDVDELVAFAAGVPDVTVARDYQYVCSDPGQELIREDIKGEHLTHVVIAACSPLMHERTFQRTCAEAGINPYMLQMANIREQVSWVTEDRRLATQKARRLLAAAISRVRLHRPLEARDVPITPAVLIVGGGVAGIEAALKLAQATKKVYLVERAPSIGGHMAQFDKTFPTLDCAACILTPKMVDVQQHTNIQLLTYAEVEEVSGHVGQYKAKIRKKPRYVDAEKCTGCGVCLQECPAVRIPHDRVIRKGDVVFNAPDHRLAAAGGAHGTPAGCQTAERETAEALSPATIRTR